MAEMATAIGFKSEARVYYMIDDLIEKGVLEKERGVERGIRVKNKKVILDLETVDLPVLGFIAAGSPIEPHTDPNLYLTVVSAMIKDPQKTYVLQVKGNSMIEEGILDGDYVIVEHREEANSGDIVIALLENGLATLKRIFFEKNQVKLVPANPQMSPIFVPQVKIQGRVIGVVRRY